MDLVNIKINDKEYSVESGKTILEAARKNGIIIPTLCFMKDINEIGACRICVVEVKGKRNLITSCTTPISEGMEIYTNSERVRKSRKATLELLLSNHNADCLSCRKSGKCELQRLAYQYDIDSKKYKGFKNVYEVDESSCAIVRDNSKCILCNKCAAVCEKIQSVGVIGKNDRGFDAHVGCNFERKLKDTSCVSCGQCVLACPTGALLEKSEIQNVEKALDNTELHVIGMTAPAVRAALGEEFGYPIGTNVTGKMAAAIHKLGFGAAFDVNFAADLTIMEEGNEFIKRLTTKNSKLPMITSCCPAWVNFAEFYYPELLPHLSTAKSPQNMFGAILKSYYAQKNKIDPKNVYVVSIMPCIAKKDEKNNENKKEYKDVDAVLTTREFADLIKKRGIDFNKLEDEEFDNPFGEGASVIFGASGGVMEAALRTVKEVLDNTDLKDVDFKEVRGMSGVKEATYVIDNKDINVAIVSGLKNIRPILEEIKEGKSKYHFIEVMSCPGGCINGAGQPYVTEDVKETIDYKAKRAKALYDADKSEELRKAHRNPDIIKLYHEYLGKPCGTKSEDLLHREYESKDVK